MMNAVMISKQKAINFYIEESAKWKQELEIEKIENERIRRLLQSYSSSDYLIDRIYPTVAGMEAFQDDKSKKKDTGKKPTVSYNKCPSPIWEGYSPRKPNKEQLEKAVNIKLKTDTTDELPENIDVTFTSSDTDHESELIKKVVDQVLDTDEEYESKSESGGSRSSVSGSKSSVKNSKTKTEFVSGGSAEEEQKKPFWRESNQEFLAEKKRNGTGVFHPKETRTCFKCNEAGHNAWNCPKNARSKQGVSQKLKEKVVDVEPPIEKFKIFENSTYEIGESSKKIFYKKKEKDNQVWVVKKVEEKVGDESGSTKPEESQVESTVQAISVVTFLFPTTKFRRSVYVL
ncbi:putative transcription factor interactor and regulator CCHC(Zn) family [Helianthus annuus]|nr:putative transcription factor interactor and regulator CCHC(Zn) family [Helianthus annuus]